MKNLLKRELLSGMRCPATILLSFCMASSGNTSSGCFRNFSYNVFLRHFGIHITWYLQSRAVWLRL